MPYDRDHMLFSWSGVITADDDPVVQEIFSGSLRFAYANGPAAASDVAVGGIDNDAAAAQVAAKLKAFWTSPAARIPINFQLGTWKWNRINRDGKYVNEQTRQGSFEAPNRGGVGIAYPFHTAIVSTYRTNTHRGLAKSGRSYWPTSIAVEQQRGGANLAQLTAFGTALAGMLDSMGNWTGIDTTPCAPVVMSKVRTGATRTIVAVEMGDQFDVMNSRKLRPEQYVRAEV